MIHILDETQSPPDATRWVMLCGEHVEVNQETGDLDPPGFDFCTGPHRHALHRCLRCSVDCPACLAKAEDK